MLVLRRKLHERIYIDTPQGERLEIVLVETEQGAVRFGLIAPRDFKIYREEIAPTKPQQPK